MSEYVVLVLLGFVLQIIVLGALCVHFVFSVLLFRNQRRLLENDKRIMANLRDGGAL